MEPESQHSRVGIRAQETVGDEKSPVVSWASLFPGVCPVITLEQFKKALGPCAEGKSDEQLIRLMDQQARLAGALFDMWRKSLKEDSQKSSGYSAKNSVT
jgi:hypothetical protein